MTGDPYVKHFANRLKDTRLKQLIGWVLQLSDLRVGTDTTKLPEPTSQCSDVDLPIRSYSYATRVKAKLQ